MRRLALLLAVAVFPGPAVSASQCTGLAGSRTDPVDDIAIADTDFSAFSWSVDNGVLTFGMTVPGLVQPVPVNRDGINGPFKEYEWGVYIDVDGRQTTGDSEPLFEGADYLLSVSYFAGFGFSGFLYLEQMQQDVWKVHDSGAYSFGFAEIQADPSQPYVQLAGAIPGIGPQSRFMPVTWWLDPNTLFGIMDTSTECRFYDPDTVHRSGFED